MSDFILYNYFRSSTSYRVRIALNLKNISYEYKSIHLLNNGGEQHLPEYKKLNPQSEVPTLIHNKRSIAQSFAIIEYLEDIQKDPALFPKEAYEKAKVRQFCENINSYIHPLGNLKVLQKLEHDHQYDAERKNAWIQHWSRPGFLALENMLSEYKGKYCFGDEITAADVFLVPAIFSANRFKVDLSPFKRCLEVNENCLQLEAFKKAHPLRQPDTPASEKNP